MTGNHNMDMGFRVPARRVWLSAISRHPWSWWTRARTLIFRYCV